MMNYKNFPILKHFYNALNNHRQRIAFVETELKNINPGLKLLDAGCGSQQYRKYCDHLKYESQDFKQYDKSIKAEYGNKDSESYEYGADINYVGDIWNINVSDSNFDAILCTEVFEHIPYPIETVKEFSRIIKPGGKLILTAPSNSLRHFDPYFFYPGFSDRWYEKILPQFGFKIEKIQTIGNYNSWMASEIARTAVNGSIFSKIILAPSFFYYYFKKRTIVDVNSLCFGYHVVAIKI